VPQHVLSAFELSKLDISESEIQALCAVLDNPTPHLGAINQKNGIESTRSTAVSSLRIEKHQPKSAPETKLIWQR
tara:strand:+ start:232 stop:456 length:225 start_codon:yes stop_codon:yes gene_type:complete